VRIPLVHPHGYDESFRPPKQGKCQIRFAGRVLLEVPLRLATEFKVSDGFGGFSCLLGSLQDALRLLSRGRDFWEPPLGMLLSQIGSLSRDKQNKDHRTGSGTLAIDGAIRIIRKIRFIRMKL
jgi:hypothetical protein